MNLLTLACLALATLPSAFTLYYTGIKEEFHPPPDRTIRENTYFGYSLTYDEYYKKLVISAPRENDIGEVYDCNIEDRKCNNIPRNINRVSKNYTHDYWFGATVKAGRDFVMMCAPRYTEYTIRKSDNMGFDAYVTQGRCYTHKKGTLTERRTIDETVRIKDSPSPMEATMDSFGWSIDVADDDSVIVGGPGMFHGRAMFYDRPEIYKPPKLIRKDFVPEFNFGYAVASGSFRKNDLSYAVSSTYGTYGFGEVSFYKGLTYLSKLPKGVDTKVVGSMFGAVLCAAKLIGKRTDLLVGAPAYATKNNYNLGAVYVYLALKASGTPKFKRRIVGLESGSMFGSAIISVGDLNGDRRHEIAIGAPFRKDGRGAVYLYSGAALISELSEKNLLPLQKIEPEPSYGESFGMSLTPLLDYDQNGCKEIAIGSPYTNTVVLLRCMASVFVETSAKFPNLQGRTSSRQEKFEFDVCLLVTYPSLPTIITARISTTVEMNHDHAKLADTKGTGRYSFITSLDDKKREYCEKVPFILPIKGKYETEIRYTISSELMDDPRTLPDFNSSRVILSDRSILTKTDSLWAAECAGKTCVPKLDLKYFISFKRADNENPYIIGSSTRESMNITLRNDGEVAYDTCVRIHFVGVNVFKPGGCVYETSTDGDRLKCEPSMPIWNNEIWSTGQIELEMNHLTNQDKMINISMILYDRCNDDFGKNDTISIPVKADPSGITAKGETDIGEFVDMQEKDVKELGKKMQHVYTLRNYGLTNWVGLPVQVILPIKPYIKYDINTVTVFFSSLNLYTPCPLESIDEKTMTHLCMVDSLMSAVEFAKILIPMYIVPGTLEGLLNKDNNVTIMSTVKFQLIGDEYGAARAITTLMFQEAEVPVETIIIAVVVGLCILIIISLILYRIGFLRRKKRQELQNLRKSVRRQTILRRSTMPSHAPPADDRRQILEGMKEEDEHEPPASLI